MDMRVVSGPARSSAASTSTDGIAPLHVYPPRIAVQGLIAAAQFLFPLGVERLPAGDADGLGARETQIDVTDPDPVTAIGSVGVDACQRFIAHPADNLSI
jgi:hypothetical protein